MHRERAGRGRRIKAMIATNVVHWPGRDTLACDLHTRRLMWVARALCFQLSVTPCHPDLDLEVECGNCANEHAKRPAFAEQCSDAAPCQG